MKFELSFLEAMDVVLGGGAVQGELFDWRCYLTEKHGVVVLNRYLEDEVCHYRCDGSMLITKGVLEQKYRVVTVFNKAGLFHQ